MGDQADQAAVTAEHKASLERMRQFKADGLGYIALQTTRPQTIAYALNDAPVGQLAWIVEKFKEWTDPAAELPEDAVDRDRLLTNVSVYWFTGTGASAAQFLYEAAHGGEWPGASEVPSGWAVFGAGDDLVRRLIDPEGNELGRLAGPAEWDSPEMVSFIRGYLERQSGSAPRSASQEVRLAFDPVRPATPLGLAKTFRPSRKETLR